jgi:hypothetical protein
MREFRPRAYVPYLPRAMCASLTALRCVSGARNEQRGTMINDTHLQR